MYVYQIQSADDLFDRILVLKQNVQYVCFWCLTPPVEQCATWGIQTNPSPTVEREVACGFYLGDVLRNSGFIIPKFKFFNFCIWK